MQTLGKPVDRIILSHAHTDHWAGLQVLTERFPDARVFALDGIDRAATKVAVPTETITEGLQAKSGHPGTPMALAPLVYVIWNEVLRFDPQNPIWPNRDRFVLSNGHASMLLWSVLYLTRTQAVNADYETVGKPSVTLDDVKHFRQLGSKAPGHPEYHLVSGVEATTGPLGQGVAMSVGMAVARKWLANRYNKPGFDIFDYNVYAICGDGDLMEGISSEAASLAGHLELDDLCWIYDNNHITIEGKTKITFTEDVAARFLAYRWNVLRVGDANDLGRIEDALAIFRKTGAKPDWPPTSCSAEPFRLGQPADLIDAGVSLYFEFDDRGAKCDRDLRCSAPAAVCRRSCVTREQWCQWGSLKKS